MSSTRYTKKNRRSGGREARPRTSRYGDYSQRIESATVYGGGMYMPFMKKKML